MSGIENTSGEKLDNYLKSIILNEKDRACKAYIELSARETLPITRRLFEEKVSLTYDFNITQLVEKEKYLIICGEGGSGKTNTLKWLSIIYAAKFIREKEGFIPIYITLNSYAKGSFYNYLKENIKEKGLSEADCKKLFKGKLLLLLDELDLLKPSDNFSPYDEISAFISEHENYKCVIASRLGYSTNVESRFAVFELEDLTDDNIKEFIEKNVSNRRQAKILKNKCLSEIKNLSEIRNISKIKNLNGTKNLNKINSKPILRNPLLLSLWIKLLTAEMETTGRNGSAQPLIPSGPIPSSREELYHAFTSYLFKTCEIKEDYFGTLGTTSIPSDTDNEEIGIKKTADEMKGETNCIRRQDLENFLIDLAFKLQCRNNTSCKYSTALKLAETGVKGNDFETEKAKKLLQTFIEAGILVRDFSEIKFGIDRSFQEYFAALKLKAYFEDEKNISETFVHPNWENVVIFTSELLDAGDKLVNSVISSGNLLLASKCAGKASLETKEKLCLLLETKLESKYTVEKIRAIQSLGILGAPGIEAISKALKDREIKVKREAVSTLGKTKSEQAICPLETAIGDEDYSVRIEAVRALGMIRSERAIELLKNTFADKNRAVRLEASEALMQIGSKTALQSLIFALGDKDDFVRLGAIGALGRTDSREVEAALIEAFQSKDKLIRLGAAEALGHMRSEKAIGTFVQALNDEDEFVRWIATKALGEIKSEKISDTFVDMLEDKSRFVRREAVKGLGVLGSEKTLDPLISALSDEDEFVRKTAAASLGEAKIEVTTREAATRTLINKLSDNSHFVRLEAAKALGIKKVGKAVIPLLFALEDENKFVRKEAANALGQLSSENILEPLIKAFESGNNFTRQGAVKALRQINSNEISNRLADEIFDFLDRAFKDEDRFVKREAAKVLRNRSESKPKTAFESVIKALDNEDSEVRNLAAESLEVFDFEEAVYPLIEILRSNDPVIRKSAARALGQIGAEEAVQPLIEVLIFDNNGFVREQAAKSLGKIKSEKAIEPLIDALMDQNNEGRSGAAEALGRLRAENTVDYLIMALKDTDDFTRLAAAKALGRIKSKKAIEPLIDTLYDWNRFVKAEAAWALGEICTKEDKELLKVLLDFENEFIANLAFEILERIETRERLKTTCFWREN
ncbi:MAG: HEAT repeat domain-containing protein [Methanosarcina sp.]